MRPFRSKPFVVLLSLALLLIALRCGKRADAPAAGAAAGGGDGGTGSNDVVTDATAPTASALPASLSTLTLSQSIQILFSESMETSSLSLGGTMASEASRTWSTTTHANDTLTISPVAAWTSGTGKTLTVNATDTSRNALSQMSLSYTISGNVMYVATTGNDANPGTSGSPFLTIQAAITAADAAYSVAEVRVMQGTYLSAATITLSRGISVYGGYKSGDWNTRDASVFTTTITDTRTVGGAILSPMAAVTLSGTGDDLVFDGFTINAGSGTYSAAFFSSTTYSYTFQNCILNGGSGSTRSMGAFFSSDIFSTAVFQNNTINPGTGGASAGIYAVGSQATFQNNTVNASTSATNYGMYFGNTTYFSVSGNTITGGSGTNSYGIYSNNTGGTFSNNTITGGSGSTASYGFYAIGGTGPYAVITGNNVNGGSGPNSYGIYEFTPGTVKNNRVHGGTGATAAYGIFANGYASVIYNNIVYGGNTSGNTYGITLFNPTQGSIRNNTVDGGSAGSGAGKISAAFYVNGASTMILQNNLLFTTSGNARYGIYIFSVSGGSPTATLQNNYFFDCPTSALYDPYAECTGNSDGDANNNTCNVTDTNSLGASTITWTASGNVGDHSSSTSPFTDLDGADNDISTMTENDWTLTGASSVNIRTGGLDGSGLSWDFTDDFASISRTANWSIGAYEKD